MVLNAFTCDVEDWYQSVYRNSASVSSNCYANVVRCLDLLDELQIKGTFFVLGNVAEQQPNVVKLIAAGGHELATHGHSHRSVFSMSHREFHYEVETSCKLIEDLAGQKVKGFRAPNFSILNETSWAFSVLADCGLEYDSSVFPMRMRMRPYGNPDRSLAPYRIGAGNPLIEVPVSLWRRGSITIPVAGGSYARFMPLWILQKALRGINEERRPFVFYCHPYEFAPNDWDTMPEKIPLPVRLRQGWGRGRHFDKVKRFLKSGNFGTVSQTLEQLKGTGL